MRRVPRVTRDPGCTPDTTDSVPATGAVTVTSRPSGTVTSPPSERVAAAVSIFTTTVSMPRRFTASCDSLTVVSSASGRGASTCAGASACGGGALPEEQPAARRTKQRRRRTGQSHAGPHGDARLSAVAADGAFERDARAEQIRLRIQLTHAAIDQPATHVQHVEQGNLAGAVGASPPGAARFRATARCPWSTHPAPVAPGPGGLPAERTSAITCARAAAYSRLARSISTVARAIPPWLRLKIGRSAVMPGPISNPSLPSPFASRTPISAMTRELSHRARAVAASIVSSAARTSGRDARASFNRASSTGQGRHRRRQTIAAAVDRESDRGRAARRA